MEPSESRVESFVIKLWVENAEPGEVRWHGYISHVPSNQRRYLRTLGSALSFIEPYLSQMGVHTGPWWRFWQRWS